MSPTTGNHPALPASLHGSALTEAAVRCVAGKKSPKQLASYTNRIQDLGVVVDCLPVLTNRYVIVGLNWLQAVIKRWWSELSAHTDKAEDGSTYVLEDEGCLYKAVLRVIPLDMKLVSLKSSVSFGSVVFPEST
ncbi:hypothetical protein TURU_164797 [Turdus rufiventris]|nr:hypothetical protein TURU_164797 [Turdus rufiventris]